MAEVRPTKRELEKLVNALKRHKGNKTKAAQDCGMTRDAFDRRLGWASEKGIKIPEFEPVKSGPVIPDEELHACWSVYERYAYNASAAAEACGLKRRTLEDRIKTAVHKFGYSKKPIGVTHARSAQKLALPKRGIIKRYLLTSLQNNTKLHDETWASLINLAKYWDAEIKVATFTYAPQDEGSVKRGTDKTKFGFKTADRWYDKRAEPYISDSFEALAPGLVWCGHFNILPTSADPLRGTENLNGRASGIWPHTRMEMRPVATAQGEATKFNWTTGTIGLRNYMQKRAGIIAEFYHCYGCVLVEVDSDGNWWPRHLNADSEGGIYDLDLYADPKGVWSYEGGIPALVYGDIHHDSLDPRVDKATWGPDGLVDLLQPNMQVIHDLLNMNPSHHNRRDPHIMYMLRKRNKDIVWDEIAASGNWLDGIHRTYEDGRESEEVVVDSNHHRHLDRMLKEVDWRDDLTNARTILRMNDAWLDAIDNGREEDFQAYEHAMRALGYGEHARFMNLTSRDPEKLSVIVCPERGGGIEVGAHHGDKGANGARGTPRGLSKLGRKNVMADKHAPGIWGGTFVAGMSGDLRQLYNIGPGGWAAAHVPIYPNGKRQVLLGWVVGDEMLFHAPR